MHIPFRSYKFKNQKISVFGNPNRKPSAKQLRPSVERLESKLVLTASTTVAGISVGQTINNVVTDTSLGGLTVQSTNGFTTTSGPNFVLLSTSISSVPFALVQYYYSTPDSFTSLAQPAGDTTPILDERTVVVQAPSGKSPDGLGQKLSPSPFDLNMSGSASGFTPNSGYIYVQAANATYILSYSSVTSTTTATTFNHCTIVGSFGALNASPFTDTVNAAGFIVQAVPPMGGTTTSINSSVIDVTTTQSFDLPVISMTGFNTQGGSMLLYFDVRTSSIVTYTGITQDTANGGYILNGCKSDANGTIGKFGQGGPQANVQSISTDPIQFEFTNNSGQGPIYVAIACDSIDIYNNQTPGYLKPGPGSMDPWVFTPFKYELNVPSYTFANTDRFSVYIPNDPLSRLQNGRIVFSNNGTANIPVKNLQPVWPSASNPTDPYHNITYDFLEFTERNVPNDGILFINTTQVDQVGMPFTMQATPKDLVDTNGVGISVTRSELFYNLSVYINGKFQSLNNNPNATLAVNAFNSLTTSQRLLNPSSAILDPPASANITAFNTYFDAAMTTFFNKYIPQGSFRIQRDGFYFSGQTVTDHTPLNGDGVEYTVLKLTQTDANWTVTANGQQYQIYAPYFSNSGSPQYPAGFPFNSNTPTPPKAPKWIAPGQSAGLAVFGNLGVFADGLLQEQSGQMNGNESNKTLSDIENSIVSAFNRGIANSVAPGNDVTDPWNNSTTFYPTPSQDGSNWSNFYAGYLHSNVSISKPNSNIGLAYGFAFDDQGGYSTTLASFATKIEITLQPFTATTSLVVTPDPVIAVVGQQKSVTVTAYKDKANTKWDPNYLGKIVFDTVSVAALGLPASYQFTPADNGIKTFSVTPKTAGSIQIVVTDPANNITSTTQSLVIPGTIAFAVETEAGAPTAVKLHDARKVQLFEISPFGTTFTGGVRVAVGDFNGDKFPDVAVISGPGMVTEMKVFDGRDGSLITSQKPFGETFTGGGFVACGDLDRDGRSEVIVTSGAGSVSRMVVLAGETGQPLMTRRLFHRSFLGGATVATSDVDGDGRFEIIVGAGLGGHGQVLVIGSRTLKVRNSFRAFGPRFVGSVEVAGGNVLGNDEGEIIVGSFNVSKGHLPNGSIRIFNRRGRLLTSLPTLSNSSNLTTRVGTYPDLLNPGKHLVHVNGSTHHSGVDSYRIVNVSPNPRKPTYQSTLVTPAVK